MWHGYELFPAHLAHDEVPHTPGSASEAVHSSKTIGREPMRWRHLQAVVRLSQVIHLIADGITDWDNIVDSFEQQVHHFAVTSYSGLLNRLAGNKDGAAPGNASGNNGFTIAGVLIPATAGVTSILTQSMAAINKAGQMIEPLSTMSTQGQVNPVASATPAIQNASDKEVSVTDVEKILSSIERFKVYSVYMSDEALVRLMTSLVALSMNQLAVHATSSYGAGDENEAANGAKSPVGRNGSDTIINVGASSVTLANVSSVGNRIRPDSTSVGLAYMVEGVRNGTISFSLQALIEITKLNSFRIAIIWQMVVSHLRTIASQKVLNIYFCSSNISF